MCAGGRLDGVEARFGCRFAADHRGFLGAGLPLGEGWPDWRDGDPVALRGTGTRPRARITTHCRHPECSRRSGTSSRKDGRPVLTLADPAQPVAQGKSE
ncbi:hypothetical protein GCM10010495_77450 [Kitasatospora herbaricolor]|nr:hypothetical protein GCM10010495_77450 [Kitasatospora herbaricolor]